MGIIVNDGAATWEIWLDEPSGNRLVQVEEVISFAIAKVANSVGAFDLILPSKYDEYLRLDGMVEFWRAPAGKTLKPIMVGRMRDFEYADERDETEITAVSGPDGNDLLDTRIVAYPAGSTDSSKTDYADDMMKEIVDYNLGTSSTDSDRDLETSLSFSIQVDTSDGPTITKSFAWKNVLKILKEIAADSAFQGTDLYFDTTAKLVSQTQISFEFKTFTGQPGRDRTGTAQVIFGKEWGNLANPSYREDYTKEINYIYAGGQGEGADRVIEEVEDTIRTGVSIWNRREGFVDARNESDTDAVISRANSALESGQPVKYFRGDLLDTPQAVYGVDWEWGDKIVVEYRGRQFEGPVLLVNFKVNNKGQETISAQVEISA